MHACTLHLIAVADTRSLFIWIGGLALFVMVGTFILVQLRKKLIDNPSTGFDSNGPAFTLDDLRQMRRDGRITDDEYEKARDRLLISLGHHPADNAKTTDSKPPDNSDDSPPPA